MPSTRSSSSPSARQGDNTPPASAAEEDLLRRLALGNDDESLLGYSFLDAPSVIGSVGVVTRHAAARARVPPAGKSPDSTPLHRIGGLSSIKGGG